MSIIGSLLLETRLLIGKSIIGNKAAYIQLCSVDKTCDLICVKFLQNRHC